MHSILKKHPQRVCVHHYHFELRIFKWSSPPLWEGKNVFIWKSLLCRLEFYRPWEQEEDPGHQNNGARIPISQANSAVRTPAASRRIAQVTGKLTGQGEGWKQRPSSWRVWGNYQDGASQALPPHALTPSYPMFCKQWLHGCVTAEITYSAECVCHEVLAWSRATCAIGLYEFYHESPGCCCLGATLGWHHGYVVWDYVMVMLWLLL